MTSLARADVGESLDAIDEFKEDLIEIEVELREDLDEIEDRWAEKATDIVDKVITPYMKDIHDDFFGIGWTPYWLNVVDGEDSEINAFKSWQI